VDRTPDIVKELSSNDVVPIELHKQSNRGIGVGGARQDIFDLANEDILACLDTQKKVDRHWVEKRLEFHQKRPEFDILSGVRSQSVVDRPANGVKDPVFLRQSNCSIRRSALVRVDGWDPWMGRGEDWDLRIRLWTSGSKSYIKSELGCKFIEPDDYHTAFGKIFGRPSSANFLRKYGWWYFQFHPIHVLGDVSSLLSMVVAILAVFLAALWTPVALILLAIPLFGATTYLYLKSFGGDEGLRDLRLIHGVIALRYFVLGYTFLSQVVHCEDNEWNYGGFDPDGPKSSAAADLITDS